MRAVLVLGGLLVLGACGGGGTTGTNYSDAPPVAEIVGTPSPKPSDTPTPEATPTAEAIPAEEEAAPANESVEANAL